MIAAVLGNDHTNSVGVIQALGKAGFEVYAFLWGRNNGFVRECRYTKGIYTGKDVESCVFQLENIFRDSDCIIPIIACCDSAALSLEKNKDRLKDRFVYEHTMGNYSLCDLAQKTLQVDLAKESGFNVPKSWVLSNSNSLPDGLTYPCLIKPLVSCQGAKSDIKICNNEEALKENISSLQFTKEILIQQYISRDYEISILGCGLSSGECIIPFVENKLTLFPKYVGLECTAEIHHLDNKEVENSIKRIIKKIGYVGVFSVEMMHCKDDNKFYFTEINLRNDGANSFIRKAGVDLIKIHVDDLLNNPIDLNYTSNTGYYIWEMHHFQSMLAKDISFIEWLKDIRKAKGFLLSCHSDMKPFYKQFINLFKQRLGLLRYENYQ